MRVVRSPWTILLCTVAGTALGVLIALNTPKIYEAATDLLIDPRDLQIVDREISQSGLSSDAALALIQNQMRIMTSGNVLNKVVDELGLQNDPEFNGQDGGIDLNPLNQLRALLAPPSDGAPNPRIQRTITVENLSRHVSVTRDSSTFVVTIWARARDPEKAADIANAMSAAFLETSAQFQAETAGRATSELTGRLDELRGSVEDAERKVEAFKAENGIVDAQGRLITDDEILKLNDQLSVARARTSELRARAATVGTLNVDAVVGGILPEQVNSPVLGQLRGQYAALSQEADRLAVRLGPRHPQRLAADVQLRSARDQIAQELRRINSSVQVELSRAERLESDLAERLETLKTRQGDLSSERVTLRELERDAASKRAVYEAYLLRSRETGEQENINTANINIISPATAPLQSSGLSRSKIVIIGLIMGLAAGIGLALLRGVWDSLRQNTVVRSRQRRGVRPAVVSALPVTRSSARPVEEARPAPASTPTQRAEAPQFPWQGAQRQGQRGQGAASAQTGWRRPETVPPLSAYAAQSAQRVDPPQRAQPANSFERSAVEEIRASLREFREAVEELKQNRQRP
ncbi:succinoglycan biosynthesis protein exop [Tianweitania sp. BSSL-BM11]|uniref:Succinoglycan biosynthesis protein exop n=1 Tax=Tianweitania aestuarii TaxID=2814886 RepID=A0ABS5RQU1_9HYPH|nr:GumC family protein [Tianweitania aestuarii]MBS9719413.1 succinoglycan biosynthesis protein exop [Tianweitania aestuarii]